MGYGGEKVIIERVESFLRCKKMGDRKHFVLLPPRLLIYLSVSIFHCCRKFLSLSHHLLYLGNGWYALNEMLLRINLF